MKEWEQHIQKDPTRAYCGAMIIGEWTFLDIKHAKNTIETGSRLQPCKECMKKIRDIKPK